MRIFLCDTHDVAWEKIEPAIATLPPTRRAQVLACGHRGVALNKTVGFLLVQYAARIEFPNLPVKDFEINEGGKPHLSGTPLHFSLSHTDGCVAVATCKAHPIGLDIEKITPRPAGFAARWFPESERQAIASASDPDAELIRRWTAKEAALKATGEGLRHDAVHADVTHALSTDLVKGEDRYALSLAPASTLPVPQWVPLCALLQ